MPKSDETRQPTPPDRRRTEGEPASPAEQTLPLSFDDLAAGKKEIQIEHRGQVYRLRATRNGGLILNK